MVSWLYGMSAWNLLTLLFLFVAFLGGGWGAFGFCLAEGGIALETFGTRLVVAAAVGGTTGLIVRPDLRVGAAGT